MKSTDYTNQTMKENSEPTNTTIPKKYSTKNDRLFLYNTKNSDNAEKDIKDKFEIM